MRLFSATVCAALCAAAFGSAGSAEQELTFIPATRPAARAEAAISVAKGSNMSFVQAELDGVACRLLVDTGATHTTFTKAFFEKNFPQAKLEKVLLGGTTNVSGSPSLATAGRLRIGDAEFRDFHLMVYPLGGGDGGFLSGVDGILGMNVLGSVRTLLSLSDSKLVFAADDAEKEGFSWALLDPSDPLSVKVRTARCWMIVDSGASFTFIDSSTGWPSSGEKVQMPGRTVDSVSMLAPERGLPGLLKLKGGAALKTIPLVMPHAPNCIGADVLLRYDLMLDGLKAGFKEREPQQDA